MKYLIRPALVLFLLSTLSGCDKGLNPDPSGFSGVIYFTNWPPPDSVWELRLVAFKNPPTDSSILILEWAKGNVLVHPPIGSPAFKKTDSTGRFVDSIHYTVILHGLSVDEPARFSYVALAWRYSGTDFFAWRPAGIYTLQRSSFIPSPITIPKHTFLRDVNIYCDFRNPPPKPWR